MDACGASSSSSSSSTPEKYDVFLSFGGEDTRDKFISHLYGALERKKIKTYKDDVSLERGDEISPALFEAIKKSKMSIIVFSKDYASSSWCLSELVHILECHRQNKQMVLPVFYEVDPSLVRKQEGSYGEAFLKHQERFKDNMEIVQKWRVALTESANLSGWDSRATRPESKLVEAIVEDVLRKLNREQSSNFGFGDLVGINEQIEEIKQLLSVCSPKARIVGIWGMGGIGKTTLAQVIFHQLSSQFEAFCFVPNVREKSEKKGALIELRDKILAELLKEKNLNLGTPSLIPTFVKERLQRTKVLIVLDDVSHVEQLNTFVGDCDQFSCESRIVITTRDASVLRDISADDIFEAKQLHFDEALQLFNSTAFRGKSPAADYIELSKNVVQYARGLPLAIRVLGSHFRSLRSQSKETWKTALDKLKAVPHDDIHNVLKISYDGLDNMEKDIFLDIACFLKGMSRDYVENMGNACGFFADNGIDDLIDKSLITIENDGRLWMHDLLEEMGRKIVCEESSELGERNRLWNAEDARQVLEYNTGTAKIQGIFLDLSKFDEEIHLEPTVFKKMHNLRLLKIYDSFDNKKCKVYLQNGQCYLPPSIRYLEWHSFPLKLLPRNFKPNNLFELKMPHSQLEQLWDGVQDLSKLRGIDLRHSIHLTKIPDLSRAPNLERINLEYCTSLLQFPLHSIPDLKMLTYANLSHCNKLQSIPDRIFDAESLRTLALKGCSSLNTLPMFLSRSLVSLDLSSTSIMSLPPSIGSLNYLSKLYLSNCKRLANLPSSINKLNHLRHLKLSGCSMLEKFPELPWFIEELDIRGTAIKEVASSSVENRYSFTRIDMSDCRSLESLPTSIFKLRSLNVLLLNGCTNLKNLPEITEPSKGLKHIHVERSGIRQIPSSIVHLIRVQVFNVNISEILKSVPCSISDITSLCTFEFSKLEYFLSSTCFVHHLECLNLQNSNIVELPTCIKDLYNLKRLYLNDCKHLRSLPELWLSLDILDASGCTSLEVVSNSEKAFKQELRNGFHFGLYSNFCDCLKLNQNGRRNIIFEFQHRVWWMAKHLVWDPRVGFCYPGNEIPKWFEYQSEGSRITIKRPPKHHDSDLLGFVACAVGGSYSDAQRLELGCTFQTNDMSDLSIQREDEDFAWEFYSAFGDHKLPATSNSEHVYMWYHNRRCYKDVYVEGASFDFLFLDGYGNRWDRSRSKSIMSSNPEVRRCGIHMLYRQDLRKFRLNFMNDQNRVLEESAAIPRDQPEPSARPRTTVNFDTDEPHSKRIKFNKFL